MTIVTRTRDVIAFGDGGNGTQIVDFTRLLLGVPTTAASDVTIDISFLGDFESPFGGQGDEFRLNIESNFSAWFTGNEYEASTASFTIGQTTWQSIISDGTIEITYDMGEGVQDFSDINGGLEEYINLTFTWDDGTIPPYRRRSRIL